jgi:hypothetical protein
LEAHRSEPSAAFLHSFAYRAAGAISGETAYATPFNAFEWIAIV